MKKKIPLLILAFFLWYSPVAGNELESWYTYWGGGWSNVTYHDEDLNDALGDVDWDFHIPLNLDLLGFYWPRGEHLLMGFVVNAFGDRYELGGDWIQINGYTYSLSVINFLQNRIGQGPFMRLDVGPALLLADTNFFGSETSDWGWGFLGGVGYGLPITSGTRLLFQLNYGLRRVEGDNTGALNLSLGGMW